MNNGLLISPYHAESHKLWVQEMISMCPEINWRVASMAPRFFDWRIRGNALALLYEQAYAPLFSNLDILVATSMTDLAALKGLCSEIRDVPCVVYFHENQFAYPPNQANPTNRMLEAKLVTLYSALAADLVLFNSRFNLQTFIAGARAMLNEFPDHAPLQCIDEIEQKSKVIPVPVTISGVMQASPKGEESARKGALKIAWNHRWEYDKGPERLIAVIERVIQRGLQCEFSIFGQRFRRIPEAFENLQERYAKAIRHVGYVEDKQKYFSMLKNHHVVFSTALHDFQGLSILEGVRLGCLPLVPDRLAYQEYFPHTYRYASYPTDKDAEANAAISCLAALSDNLLNGKLPKPPKLDELAPTALAPEYRATLNSLLADGKGA